MTQFDVRNEDLATATTRGMTLAWHAARQGDAPAIDTAFESRTFAEANARANRIARLFAAHGIGPGDAVALVMRNRAAFVEVFHACLRSGIRVTPVNFHLNGEQAGYVVDNCEARALVHDATLGTGVDTLAAAPRVILPLSVGGEIDGFTDLETAAAQFEDGDPDAPVLGSQMLYTSGTTGRPKGVYRKQTPPNRLQRATEHAAWNPGEDRCLCTGPAYHAAPLAFNVLGPIAAGVGVVLMDKWDAHETLRLVERHGITHTHMVATMFHRLLALPEAVRSAHDLSTLRYVLHGAAPTPVHVKQAMIDWLGPVLFEYYAATEGGGNYFITSEEWLRKPGSVGHSPTPEYTRVLDEDGDPVPPGEVGTLYFEAPAVGAFEYFKSPEKTGESYRDGFFTLGDMGYLDADGYLFLTGRSAETIISGGVNIYPSEIDAELLKHAAIADVCTIGVPNDEWGEEIKAVVQLAEGVAPDDALREELMAFARTLLPGFKCPRSIDFVDQLPRLESGKIQRRTVREPYWAGRRTQI
ncbi:MAG TPA: AMP-binding protein [Pseudomonadales bacterium]|nr:AMP-binding protein [Pseudomonadales bacterium]